MQHSFKANMSCLDKPKTQVRAVGFVVSRSQRMNSLTGEG